MTTDIQARRNALGGHRYTVTFYGGWYVIDEHSSRAYKADSIEQAVTVAETGNTTEV